MKTKSKLKKGKAHLSSLRKKPTIIKKLAPIKIKKTDQVLVIYNTIISSLKADLNYFYKRKKASQSIIKKLHQIQKSI